MQLLKCTHYSSTDLLGENVRESEKQNERRSCENRNTAKNKKHSLTPLKQLTIIWEQQLQLTGFCCLLGTQEGQHDTLQLDS